jgi:hypothetical protein
MAAARLSGPLLAALLLSSLFALALGGAYPGYSTEVRRTSPVRWSTPFGLVGFPGAQLKVEWTYITALVSSTDTVTVEIQPLGGSAWTTVVAGRAVSLDARRLLGAEEDDSSTPLLGDGVAAAASSDVALSPLSSRRSLQADDGKGSYLWPVPNNYAAHSQWVLRVSLDGSSPLQSDTMVVAVKLPGTRAFSPMVSLGQDSDILYGGSSLTMRARAYNFARGDKIQFQLFKSGSGLTGCDVSQYFWHGDGTGRMHDAKTSQPIVFGTRHVTAVGSVSTPPSSGDAGEEFVVEYTLPTPTRFFVLPGTHYIAAAYWVNESTFPIDPVAYPRAPTPSGYPQNETSRSRCFDWFGTTPGSFPALAPLRIAPTAPAGASTTVTWTPVLVPYTDPLTLKLRSAVNESHSIFHSVISTTVANDANYSWAVPANLPAGFYVLELSSPRYSVSTLSRNFFVSSPASLVAIAVTSPLSLPATFASARVSLFGYKHGDTVPITWTAAPRPGGATGSVAFNVDVMSTDGTTTAATHASLGTNVAVTVPGTGSVSWTIPSMTPLGHYYIRVRLASNLAVAAVSTPFEITPSGSALPAQLPTSLVAQFHSPAPDSVIYFEWYKNMNVTVQLWRTSILPPDLKRVTVSLYRGSMSRAGGLPDVHIPVGAEFVKEVTTVCLQEDVPNGCYAWNVISSATLFGGATISATVDLTPNDRTLLPHERYFLVLSSPDGAYPFVVIRSHFFAVRRHRITLHDDENYWNTTSYFNAAALRAGDHVAINISSTLAFEDSFEVFYMKADPNLTPDEELAAASWSVPSRFPGTVVPRYQGNGTCQLNANNFCDRVVSFIAPPPPFYNVVLVLALRSHKHAAYAWAYHYFGQTDQHGSGRITNARPYGSEVVWKAGAVMPIQWTTEFVAFTAPIKVAVGDSNGWPVIKLTDAVSNLAGTTKWNIPLGICDGISYHSTVCNGSIMIKLAVAKNDVIWSNSHLMRILPLQRYIAVLEPTISSRWTAGQPATVAWATYNISSTAMCDVQLWQSRYFTAKGDRKAADLALAVPCAAGSVTFTVPFGLETGWPGFVVVYAPNITEQVWGRSNIFYVRVGEPRSVSSLLLGELCPNGLPAGGVDPVLCAVTCSDCGTKGGIWVPAASVSLDFDVSPWPGTKEDLATLKAALGASRTEGVNICWRRSGASPVPRIYLPASVAFHKVATLVPGVSASPFFALESDSVGVDPCPARPTVHLPIMAALTGNTFALRIKQVVNEIQDSAQRLINLPGVGITVEFIAQRDAGAEGSGTVPAATMDSETGRTVGGPTYRRLADIEEETEAVPDHELEAARRDNLVGEAALVRRARSLGDSSLRRGDDGAAAAAAAPAKARRFDEPGPMPARNLQRCDGCPFPLLPVGPKLSMLLSLMVTIERPTLAEAQQVADAFAAAGPAAINGGAAVESLAVGAPRVYTPAQLTSTAASSIYTSELYVTNLVVSGATHPTSGEGGLDQLINGNAFTDGTAAFQWYLLEFRKEKPVPWTLPAWAIALIVFFMLALAFGSCWLYIDYKYKIKIFRKLPPPPRPPPPPGKPAYLASLEDALALHDEINDMDEDGIPRKAAAKKAADGSGGGGGETPGGTARDEDADKPYVPLTVKRHFTGQGPADFSSSLSSSTRFQPARPTLALSSTGTSGRANGSSGSGWGVGGAGSAGSLGASSRSVKVSPTKTKSRPTMAAGPGSQKRVLPGE